MLIGWPSAATATPLHSLRAASRCDSCHIEPIGWADPPEVSQRRCTVDCTACHVGRDGGGLRTPAGNYFGRERLPTFGARPGVGVDPERYRSGDSRATHGTYSLWHGFGGWDRGGTTPVDNITDRYGHLDAEPFFSFGGDLRVMAHRPTRGASAIFPMQAEIYGALMPTDELTFYAAAGLQGRRRRTFDAFVSNDAPSDYITVREIFAEWGGLPYNGFVRAGRFTKPYGWRIPDHTTFTRGPLGFDPFAQVFGVEAGLNPNYPFGSVALFYQGLDPWPGERAPPAFGVAASGGFRDLGWQAGGSLEYLRLTDSGSDRITFGPHVGVNFEPVAYLGEVDLQLRDSGDSFTPRLAMLQQLTGSILTGLDASVSYELLDVDVSAEVRARQRLGAQLQWRPYTFTEIAVAYRWTFVRGSPNEGELLVWTHLWY